MDKKSNGSNAGWGIGSLTLLFAAISYFILGGLSGFFGVMILGILFGFCLIMAFIPFGLGLGAQIPVMLLVVQPWVFQLSGIQATGLTWALFGIYVAAGTVINIFASIYAYAWLADR